MPPSIPASAVTVEAVNYIATDSQQFSDFISAQHQQRSKQYDDWFNEVVKRDLQEKRKIAPGYLDTTNRILQPEKVENPHETAEDLKDEEENGETKAQNEDNDIDKVFGKVTISGDDKQQKQQP